MEYSNIDISELKLSDVRDLPTLSVGQADDLKIDTGTMRVWVARCGPEDGYHGPALQYESLRRGGNWVACDKYGNRLAK